MDCNVFKCLFESYFLKTLFSVLQKLYSNNLTAWKAFSIGWIHSKCSKSGAALPNMGFNLLGYLASKPNTSRAYISCSSWKIALISDYINRRKEAVINYCYLTLSRRRPWSYRSQSINLLCKSMDWFLYDNGLRHESVKAIIKFKKKIFCQFITTIQHNVAIMRKKNSIAFHFSVFIVYFEQTLFWCFYCLHCTKNKVFH